MLDELYMKDVEKYLENDHFIIWKFPSAPHPYEKQKRPVVYSYSIMTRAYGTWFNPDSFISYFNEEGFDVYLVDWGKSALFTLSGWTLKDLSDHLEHSLIDPLLEAYGVETLNVFAVCIGGGIVSHMIESSDTACHKIHRISYYGVPILGTRDLGMEKSFRMFYKIMEPWTDYLKYSGLSLFLLDQLILYSGSMSMLTWTWNQFWNENEDNSFYKILFWTIDDRWVPVPAMMDIIRSGFFPEDFEFDFHMGKKAENIHFLNIVGEDDMLVKPSASIVEYNSDIPDQYKSFKQMILDTDHFMFARPGMQKEKKEIVRWFAGYDFSSMIHKLKTEKKPMFVERTPEIVGDVLNRTIEKLNDQEKEIFSRRLNELLNTENLEGDSARLSDLLTENLITRDNEAWYDEFDRHITPLIEKSPHRGARDTT